MERVWKAVYAWAANAFVRKCTTDVHANKRPGCAAATGGAIQGVDKTRLRNR